MRFCIDPIVDFKEFLQGLTLNIAISSTES